MIAGRGRFAVLFALALLPGCGRTGVLSGAVDDGGPEPIEIDASAPPRPEDMAAPRDLGAADLSAPDLSTPDLSVADLAMPDRGAIDAPPPPPPADMADIPDLLSPSDLALPSIKPGLVVINEVHSTNLNGVLDEDGDNDDWVELYNTLPTPIDLTGVGLSTNPGAPFNWTFPRGTAIPAKSYLTVWTSKKGRRVLGRPLHASFTIENGAESIYLTAPGPVTIDSTTPARSKPDISWCRIPDASGPFQHCLTPTYDSANGGASYPSMLTPPSVTVQGGFYATPQTVELLTAEMGADIRYTLDGSTPTANSARYAMPIAINSRVGAPNVYARTPTSIANFYAAQDAEVYKATVLRAATFANGKLSSPVNTHTYFVDPNIAARYVNTPVISIAVDPPSYFSSVNPRGIYVPGPTPNGGAFNINANFWLPTEVQASLEFFKPDRTIGIRTDFGSQISGNYSRNFQQKSLDVIFRDPYGAKNITYPLFADRAYTKFKRFRLRNTGNDYNRAMIHDAFINLLVKNSPIGWGAWSPSVLFLDGEYWGYIEVREKTTDDYLSSAFGVDPDKVDIIDIEVTATPMTGALVSDNLIVKDGTRVAYDALIGFVANHSMAVAADYAVVKSLMDTDNFINWYAAQLFIGNRDWPHNNTRMFRERTQNAKWRWVFFDTDFGFGGVGDAVTVNSFGSIGNGTRIGNLCNQLLANAEFKNQFIQGLADQLNAWFSVPAMDVQLDAMVKQMQPLIPESLARYNLLGKNVNTWLNNINTLRTWYRQREANFVAQAQTKFALGNLARYTLTVNVNDLAMGNVKVNTLDLKGRLVDVNMPWSGKYFPNVPLSVTALPRPGYKFVQWMGASQSNQATIQLNTAANASLTAVFAVDAMPPPPPPPPPPEPPGVRNLALGAIATQSSTQAPYTADLAVDGDVNGALQAGSVSRTNSEANAWWQVDLGQVVDVYRVQLFNRTDCCADQLSEFHIFVSSADMTGRTYGSLVADQNVSKTWVTGPVTTESSFIVAARGRYVRLQLARTGNLNLAEVEIDAVPLMTAVPDLTLLRNLALGRAATQSSVANGGVAGRAVDGDPDGNFAAGATTLTNAEMTPWWEVDLGASKQLYQTFLLNRTDCCGTQLGNFNVFISATPMAGKSLAQLQADPNVWKADIAGPVGRYIKIPTEARGRFVRVQLKGMTSLSLSEVVVLGLP